jgi:hypothetical protein
VHDERPVSALRPKSANPRVTIKLPLNAMICGQIAEIIATINGCGIKTDAT